MTNFRVIVGTVHSIERCAFTLQSHTHTHDTTSPHRKHAVSTTFNSACSTVVVPTLITFVSPGSYLAENTVLATLNYCLGLYSYSTQKTARMVTVATRV